MKNKHGLHAGRAKASPRRHRRQFDLHLQKQERIRKRQQSRHISKLYQIMSAPKLSHFDNSLLDDIAWWGKSLSTISIDDVPASKTITQLDRNPFTTRYRVLSIIIISALLLNRVGATSVYINESDYDPDVVLANLMQNVRLTDCRAKTMGVSSGKICFFSAANSTSTATEHMLKEVTPRSFSTALRTIARSNQLQSIGVSVPAIKVVGEGAKTYLATEFDTSFKTEAMIHRETLKRRGRALRRQEDKSITYHRETVVEKIGEEGIAKLAVTGTLTYDVITNPGNWGYNEKGLVVIDVDLSPKDSTEYYDLAYRMPTDINIALTVDNVIQMKGLYEQLLGHGETGYYAHLGIKFHEFYEIVANYIEACKQTISTIAKSFPALTADQPDDVVNRALQRNLHAFAMEHPRMIVGL